MQATVKRRPGRPPTYVFDRPDEELTENERRLRSAVLKRRERQNRSYRRRKLAKSQQLAAAAALRAAAVAAGPPAGSIPTSAPRIPSSSLPQARPALALFDAASLAAPTLPPPAPTSDAAALRPPLYLPRLQSPPTFGARVPLPHASLPLPAVPAPLPAPQHSHTAPPPPHQSQGVYDAQVSPYAFEVPPPAAPTAARPETATVTTGALFPPSREGESPLADSLALPFSAEAAAPPAVPTSGSSTWMGKYEPTAGSLTATHGVQI